jgi:hypothetical protein
MADVTHRNEDGAQYTTVTVEVEDATGEAYTHQWDGPADGALDYQGDGDPPSGAGDALAGTGFELTEDGDLVDASE